MALRTIHAHLSFVFEITFVRNDDDGEGILVLHSQDLLVERADFLKRVARRDRVHKKEALAGSHVLFPHSPKRLT